jgi:hypothetical protein
MQCLCQVLIAWQSIGDAAERWLAFGLKGSKIHFLLFEKTRQWPGSSIRLEQEPLTLVVRALQNSKSSAYEATSK